MCRLHSPARSTKQSEHGQSDGARPEQTVCDAFDADVALHLHDFTNRLVFDLSQIGTRNVSMLKLVALPEQLLRACRREKGSEVAGQSTIRAAPGLDSRGRPTLE